MQRRQSGNTLSRVKELGSASKQPEQYGFKPSELSPEEENAISGVTSTEDQDDIGLVPMEDAW